MPDIGHLETEAILAKMEKKVAKQYQQAAKEARQKYREYMDAFKQKDAMWKARLAAGEITKAQYNSWCTGQIMTGNRWHELVNTLATDYHNANQIARSIINGYLPDVYALNANYSMYNIEHGGKIGTSFTLYDKQTVERILREDPQLIPPPSDSTTKAAIAKDLRWQKQNIQSQTLQGILQGEDSYQIADRITQRIGEENYKAAVRYARTAVTGAQNAGRYDGYHRAKNLGIDLTIEWMATLDNRTRHEHRQLDGQRRDVDEPFEVSGVEILYPGQTGGTSDIPQSLIWNCRCTLAAWVKGFEPGVVTSSPKMGGMSYEEWKNDKETYTTAKHAQQWIANAIAKSPGITDKYADIWYNKVIGYADYDSVKDSIQSKIDYYNQKIPELKSNGQWAQAHVMQSKLDWLQEYQQNGPKYSQLLKDYDAATARVAELAPKPKPSVTAKNSPFGPDAYTQARKDAALWAKSPREADAALREKCGEVWRNATAEQRDGIFEYTSSYHKYNEPLRGIEYGTNDFLGVGNTNLNPRGNGDRLNAMTDIIDQSSYDFDMWLNRGVGYSGMDKFFGVDRRLLEDGSQAELEQALLGKTVTEYGFMSCGSAKGTGFSDDIKLNIYAPSGTKMMYVEPFSAFGMGDGESWDGISKQSGFGSELETILQQGTRFEITKIDREYAGGRLFIDMQVIGYAPQQRWTP